jgi:hypothetical protein
LRVLVSAALAALVLVPAAHAWTWPVGGAVLQPFAFDPSHPYAAGQHRGIDIGGEPGATVVAPVAGPVTFAGSVPSSGRSVTITTADGYAVTLTHLGSIAVNEGAVVDEGAAVGAVGPSGDPELAQPYVHLGIRVAAQDQGYVDPLGLLPARPSSPAAPAPPPPAAPAPAPASSASAPAEPTPAAAAPAPAAAASRPATAPPPEAPASTPAPSEAPAPPVSASAPVIVRGSAPARARRAPARRREPTAAVRASSTVAAARPARVAAVSGAPRPATHDERRPQPQPHAETAPVDDVRAADTVRLPARVADRARSVPPAPRAGRATDAPSERGTDVVRASGGPRPSVALVALLAVLAVLAAIAAGVARKAVRMIARSGNEHWTEDPGGACVAVRGWSPAPGTRGGLRRAVGRVRALPPAQGQRRAHGLGYRRAWDAGHGRRRQGGQVLR